MVALKITMEELQAVEHIARTDPKVIEQCEISGIPKSDMHKVYCDPWTIGYDERHGNMYVKSLIIPLELCHEQPVRHSQSWKLC